MKLEKSFYYKIFIVLVATMLLRFVSLFILELGDTTESRYAGIAMRMIENGNFITPEISPNIPFLAKPPLSFWITALSFKFLGFTEFAARLPHFICSVLLLIFVYFSVKKYYNSKFAIITTVIAGTTPIFIAISGYVMTESVLILFTSIAMISSWIRLEKDGKKIWSYLFFIALGLIMLIKGPVGIVMTCGPLGIYLTIKKKWKIFFKSFNIISGSFVSILIFLPWYIIQEIKNPGFIDYFIIGEHVKRFLIEEWSGDKYGSVHSEPQGMILLFFAIGTFPWILEFIYESLKSMAQKRINLSNNTFFFSCFMIFPLIFFTLTKGIVFAYTSFSIIPFAILLTNLIEDNRNIKTIICIFSPISGILTSLFLYLYISDKMPWKSSDKKSIEYVKKYGNGEVFYINSDVKFSSMFYSRDNKDIIIKTIDGSEKTINNFYPGALIVMNNIHYEKILNEKMRSKLQRKVCDRTKTRCLYEYKN